MRPYWIIGIALAAPALAATAARCQTAAPAAPVFDENAAAAIHDLATKAAAQKITDLFLSKGVLRGDASH